MNTLEITLIVLLIVLILACCLSVLFFIKRIKANHTNNNQINSKQIEQFMIESKTILESVQKNAQESNSLNNNNFGSIKEALSTLQSNNNDISKIFLNIKQRGNFGEFQLETLLKDAFGEYSQLVQMQYRLPNIDGIIDAVIKISDSNYIAIDAKFPLENYKNIIAANNSESYDAALKKFKRDILDKVKEVVKYISPANSIDCVILFIPSEAVYARMIEHYGNDLIQEGYKKKVYFTSPTTLAALIDIFLKNVDRKQTIKNVDRIIKDLQTIYQQFDQ
jgi:DNA recombination protein RmuC